MAQNITHQKLSFTQVQDMLIWTKMTYFDKHPCPIISIDESMEHICCRFIFYHHYHSSSFLLKSNEIAFRKYKLQHYNLEKNGFLTVWRSKNREKKRKKTAIYYSFLSLHTIWSIIMFIMNSAYKICTILYSFDPFPFHLHFPEFSQKPNRKLRKIEL